YAAFIAHAKPALRVSETALFVVDAVNGVGVQTEKAWEYAADVNRACIIAVNKLEKERADFGATLDSLRETFGRTCVPFTLPIGKEKDFRGIVDIMHMKAYEFDSAGKAREVELPAEGRGYIDESRERLVEMVAEADDKLMEKFFEAGTLNDEEGQLGIRKATVARSLTPIFAVSAATMVGVASLLDAIIEYAPDPSGVGPVQGLTGPGGDRVERVVSDEESIAAYVFRSVMESFGRITVFKI